MNRVNLDNLQPCTNRVNSTIPIKIPAEGISFRRRCSGRDGWHESALTHLTRERSWYYGASSKRSGRAWPRALAVTISEWRLHVWLCGAFHVLIVRLSVSPFGRARTGRRIANPPSSATSRRENFARHLRRWLVRKKAPRESPRDEDDAGTTSLRENLAGTRYEWKWSRRRWCPTALSRRWKA